MVRNILSGEYGLARVKSILMTIRVSHKLIGISRKMHLGMQGNAISSSSFGLLVTPMLIFWLIKELIVNSDTILKRA